MLRRISFVSFLFAFSSFVFANSSLTQAPSTRHFTFEYSFTVRVTDPGKPLEIWFPMAHSDRYQQVKILSKHSDLPLRETSDPEYGNRMFYAHTVRADKPEYHFSVTYDVLRLEHLADTSLNSTAPEKELNRFLQPDQLVPITGKPAEIAAAQVKPGMSDMEKARALYEYTFNNMRYDKTGTGWGHGDAVWACDSHHGNCTDFHSLFIAMARSQHIPARFEIGFAVPENKTASDVAGYHCWAEFYTRERGWFPVDISEAWQQKKKEYFFGANDVNRIQFTVGRDLELNPKQHGTRLNYFIYPYAELNGEEYPNVAIKFSFTDVGQSAATRASRKAEAMRSAR
ncbi:MAG TPA: transglutaminase domain-containing protein [Candidatus Angelobacter sp.]|nr:transglutaminase domain-containing protein [Candidatus Angelobacter sp.]